MLSVKSYEHGDDMNVSGYVLQILTQTETCFKPLPGNIVVVVVVVVEVVKITIIIIIICMYTYACASPQQISKLQSPSKT